MVEDFTTYTEVDPGDDITVTSTKVEWVAMVKASTSYVYKDYGVSHFGDFEHDIEVQYNTSGANSQHTYWAECNSITTMKPIWDSSIPALVYWGYLPGTTYLHYIRDGASGNSDYWDGGSANTLYYCTVKRAGTTFTVKIYSDSARTTLLATMSCTCGTTLFRYLYACMSSGWSGGTSSGLSQNFDLKEAAPITEEIFDTVSISDTISFKHEIYPLDSINIIDNISYKHLISLFDTINVNDSTLIKRLLILADSVNINDNIIYKHLINLTDSINISDDAVYKHIIALADSIGVSDSILIKYIISLFDTVDIEDSVLFKHILNLFDTISVTDSFAAKHSVFLLDNISILDDIDITIFGDCSAIFQLQGDSYTIFLPMPEYAGEAGSLNNELELFDFWSNERSVNNIGIDTEPIILGGIIFACSDSKEAEMTIIATKFLNIHEMMDNHEEIRITGLNECADAVYIIKNFKYGTIRHSPYAYTWQLTLEYVRAL